MVRSRARLIPPAALLLAGLPLATASTPVAAAPMQRPVLSVPRAMLKSPSVPVILEMGTPSPSLLANSPQLRGLLSTVQSRLLGVLRANHARNVYAYHLIPAIAATVPGNALPALLQQPGIRAITLDRRHVLPPLPDAESLRGSRPAGGAPPVTGGTQATINVPQTIEPESYTLTRANVAVANGFRGDGIRVAVIDSGLDMTQPDLRGVLATDANGAPLYADFTGTGLQDTVGHGTACTSMIAAQGRILYTGDNRLENGLPLQVYPAPAGKPTIYRSYFHMYGMAPNVRILAAKIFDTRAPHDGGFDSWIIRAIEWAVDHHADVISESFGGEAIPSNGTDPTALADEAAVRAGVTVVVADGNAGPGQTTIQSPASAPDVIGVGASTEYRNFGQTGFLAEFGRTTADNVASFTSRGPTTDGRPRPDLVAPGAFTWGLFPQTKSEDGPTSPPYNVGTFGGTSQATPVTAGAAALVIEAYEHMHNGMRPAPALVRAILMSSAHDLGYPASDQGAGRLDAWQAVQTALHTGPSFLLKPESLAVTGAPGTAFQRSFTISNSGSVPQHYHIDAWRSHQTGVQQWNGTVTGTELKVYHFTVAPGLERIVGSVYWNSASRFKVQGSNKEVALRVALYDPQGRFVNYSYGVGSGYAEAQAGHPAPGTWTLVVTENGRKDNASVRHYTTESYQARLETYMSLPYGSLSTHDITLLPGQTTHVTLRGATPSAAGIQVISVRVTGNHSAVLPVVLTSYIPIASGGFFEGNFTGASNGYFSLANENKVYSFDVPRGTRTVKVVLSWPDPGYGIILLLVDPSGEIVNGQFSGVGDVSSGAPLDLSAHNLDALWSNPAPGRWQLVVMGAVFSGKQRIEPFQGRVTLNENPVTPIALSRTVVPGAGFDINLTIHNTNGPNVAEGYVGYATTNTYGYVSLGTIRTAFKPAKGGASTYTYQTGFVPPATRMIVSSFATTGPNVPVDISLGDPIGFARAEGIAAPVTVDGHTYQGTSAVVTGPELPIGRWNGEITLRRPQDAGVHTTLVGTSYAYALTPFSWVSFDHGLNNGRITGGQPLILLPQQHDVLHASVNVPLDAAPGTYHAHLFVYTVFGDQVADVPLAITVQPQTGSEPAIKHPFRLVQ